MKRLVQTSIAIILILACGDVIAATLEVGSGQAYTTISSAITAASPGDIINVHTGTYIENLNINKSGLTLQNNAGDTPVLSGKIEGNASNNTVIDGLEITGWAVLGTLNVHGIHFYGATGVTVKNCKIHAYTLPSLNYPTDTNYDINDSYSGIYIRASKQVLVSNNIIHNCNKGINLSAQDSTDATYANGTIIQNNTIYDNPIDGIDILGMYYTVSGNNVYNNIDQAWTANHPDGIQLIASVDGAYTSVQHAKIFNNTFRNHTQNIFVEGQASLNNTEDIYVYNNVSYTDSGTINGVNLDTTITANIVISKANQVYVYNNTIGRARGVGIRVANCTTGSIHVKNNIISNSNASGDMAVYEDVAGDIADGELNYNLYNMASGNIISWGGTRYYTLASFKAAQPAQEVNGVSADPMLNSFPTPTLQPSSPAILAGVNLSTIFTTDKNGMTRPASPSPWDMGAYQFDTIIPNAPVLDSVQ